MLEIHGVQGLDQWQIENAEIDRRIVALVAVVVPGVVRRQHHVAGAEGDVLALDPGEVELAGEAEADGVRRMPVRRHDLVGIVEPKAVYMVDDRGALGRQARIDQDQRTALGGFRC